MGVIMTQTWKNSGGPKTRPHYFSRSLIAPLLERSLSKTLKVAAFRFRRPSRCALIASMWQDGLWQPSPAWPGFAGMPNFAHVAREFAPPIPVMLSPGQPVNPPPAESDLDARIRAARSIRPGSTVWNVRDWPDPRTKPRLEELRAEIMRRDAKRVFTHDKQTNKRTARRHVRTHGTEHANRRETTREQGE